MGKQSLNSLIVKLLNEKYLFRVPDLGVPWPRFNSSFDDLQYMHIAGPGNFRMESDNNLAQIKFWNRIGV